jgi:hypothetical protein
MLHRFRQMTVLWLRLCAPSWAALALAAILDDPQHVAVQPAAARQLVAILGTLSKRTQRRGKLAVVKSVTTSSPSA